jgi:hypothetical protein
MDHNGYVNIGLIVFIYKDSQMKKSGLKHVRRPSRQTLVVAGIILATFAVTIYTYYGYLRGPRTGGAAYTAAPMAQAEMDQRKQRILAIYDSLKLGAEYTQTDEEIFGEKRVYSWDNGRSFSSSRMYVRQADVNATVAELRPLIKQAGFSFVDEPYPGAVDVQLHFKSARGEYLRLTVSSKLRDDAVRKASAAKTEPDYNKLPYRDAPSNVLIKVNLDDNNE